MKVHMVSLALIPPTNQNCPGWEGKQCPKYLLFQVNMSIWNLCQHLWVDFWNAKFTESTPPAKFQNSSTLDTLCGLGLAKVLFCLNETEK